MISTLYGIIMSTVLRASFNPKLGLDEVLHTLRTRRPGSNMHFHV